MIYELFMWMKFINRDARNTGAMVGVFWLLFLFLERIFGL